MKPALTEVRVDKWLWAARFFKTRSIATHACTAGHVKLEGSTAKPSKAIRIGANIEVLTPGGPKVVEVAALSDKRGPASVARELYVDHTPPPPPKEESAGLPQRARGEGRPSKRDLRLIRKLRGY